VDEKKEISLRGDSKYKTTINGKNAKGGSFLNSSNSDVVISDLSFNRFSHKGDLLYANKSNLSLNNVRFMENGIFNPDEEKNTEGNALIFIKDGKKNANGLNRIKIDKSLFYYTRTNSSMATTLYVNKNNLVTIDDSAFINNIGVASNIFLKSFNNKLTNNAFIYNKHLGVHLYGKKGDGGGAIKIDYNNTVDYSRSSARISDSYFIGNQASGRSNNKAFNVLGGAIYSKSTDTVEIVNSLFVGNEAINNSENSSGNAYGGALYSDDYKAYLGSSIFINNYAKSKNGLAHGGALFSTNEVLIINSKHGYNHSNGINKTIFYGNKDSQGYNSIVYKGDDDDYYKQLKFEASKSNEVLILDPMRIFNASLISFEVYSNTAEPPYTANAIPSKIGGLYLGGHNLFETKNQSLNVSIRNLVLTTVDYGDGTTPQEASIEINKGKEGNVSVSDLRGTGTIKASNVTVSGHLHPTLATNTGIKAADIKVGVNGASNTLLKDIYNIGVKEVASNNAHLTFKGNVAFNTNGSGGLLLDVSAKEHGKVVINGELKLNDNCFWGKCEDYYTDIGLTAHDDTPTSGNNITLLTADRMFNFKRILSDKTEVNETQSIANSKFRIKQANFLDIDINTSASNNNSLVVSYDYKGLMWNTSKQDEGGKSLAHGTFDVLEGQTFTVNSGLDDRKHTYGFANKWDGKTLSKGGYGTLILNGKNTYTGETIVEGGTLIIGDKDHPNAKVAGDVVMRIWTDGSGFVGGNGSIGGNLTFVDIHNSGYSSGGLYVDLGEAGENVSKLKVDGKATLNNSRLFLQYSNGAALTKNFGLTHTILEAKGGIEGKFLGIGTTTSLYGYAFIEPSLKYTPTTVELTIVRKTDGSDADQGLKIGDIAKKWNIDADGYHGDDLNYDLDSSGVSDDSGSGWHRTKTTNGERIFA